MDITLSQIGLVSSLLACEPIKATRYWLTDVRMISVHMLKTLHAELENHHGQNIADNCLKAFINEAYNDFLIGRIDNEQLLEYQLPIRTAEANSAKAVLSNLTGMKHLAVLFSLIEQIPLRDTVRMDWSDIRYNTLQPDSKKLLRSVPKHLNSDYVFWEFDANHQFTWPLYKFASSFHRTTDMPWFRFAECILIAGVDLSDEVSKTSGQEKPISLKEPTFYHSG